MDKVLLVSMPFGALGRPALGLSLLQACLARAGVACDLRYLTFPFAELIGVDEYAWISSEVPATAFAGDWAFTAALYGERPGADRDYLRSILRDRWRLDDRALARILRVRSLVTHFLEYCVATVPWDDYTIVGFTSTFEQNIASLALARRIKHAYPAVTVVFGGANWEGEMGQELHRRFPFVDYVCSGEAEESFPALVQHVLAGMPSERALERIPGIVFRRRGRSVDTGAASPIRNLDALPFPDYGDYFRDLEQSTTAASVLPILLVETSRGCWWGAKSHCTFCGLNGGAMSFRAKRAERVLAELEFLTDRWRLDLIEVVDNILDMRYFGDLLPALARARRPWRFFYEVKANLTRDQLALLRAAGVDRIQPGIESLSDHVLGLMRKGTTALRNVQVLKWCKELGIAVDWNILYGFPGETRADYEVMARLLPAIRFLQPPCACAPVRLDRFSPFHASPAAFGFENVRPMAPYRFLYPFPEDSLRRIAYYFDADYAPDRDPSGHAAPILDAVTVWQRAPERGALFAIPRPDGSLALLDRRSDAATPHVVLSGPERSVYEYCDAAHSVPAIIRHLRTSFPQMTVTEAAVGAFLDALVARRLMITDGANYLSLALRAEMPARGGGQQAAPSTPAGEYTGERVTVSLPRPTGASG